VKVCRRGNDLAWVSYIKWAQQTPFRQMFAPKLYALKFHRGFYVAVLERVETIAMNMRDEDADKRTAFDRLTWWRGATEQGLDEASRLLPAGLALFVQVLREQGANDFNWGNYGKMKDGRWVVLDPTTNVLESMQPEFGALKQRYRSPASRWQVMQRQFHQQDGNL
jgi:hypothetical protein